MLGKPCCHDQDGHKKVRRQLSLLQPPAEKGLHKIAIGLLVAILEISVGDGEDDLGWWERGEFTVALSA